MADAGVHKPATDGEAVDPLAGIDLVIDVRRQAAEAWAKRLDGIESRATAIGAVAVTLSTALVGLSTRAHTSMPEQTSLAFVLLVAAAGVSVIGRVYPRHRLGRWTEGCRQFIRRQVRRTGTQQEFDDANQDLRTRAQVLLQLHAAQQRATDRQGLARITESAVRLEVLRYWETRETSTHHAYDAKAAWTGAAATLFVVALIFLASLGYEILASQVPAGVPDQDRMNAVASPRLSYDFEPKGPLQIEHRSQRVLRG